MEKQRCEIYETCARIKSILKILLVIETILVASLRSEEVMHSFRCINGEFIYTPFFCDGSDDCSDGSDELFGCDPSCGPGNFLCKDQNCLPISVRCNSTSECQDKSDEMYCDHELRADEGCTIEKGKYLCKDKLRCIELRYVCDNAQNCFDGSDESDKCLAPGEDLCDTCFHPCFPTPNNGPRCFCNTTNKTFDALCDEMKPCQPNHYQRCVEFQNITHEYCVHDYRKNNSEERCINDVPYGKLLIYSVKGIVKVFNFTNNETRKIHTTELRTAVTAAQDYIYWADISTTPEHKTSIFKTSIKNNDQIEEIIKLKYNENLVNCISVDWIAGNIYFTRTELGTLSVCSFNGRICSQFNNKWNGITYVAVAPRSGSMFWTFSRSKHYIVKSHMDGSNSRIIISKHNPSVSLTIDEEYEKIYWWNSRFSFLKSANFDGSDEKLEQWSMALFSSIIAFSFFEKDLYFIMTYGDEFHKKVYSERGESTELLVEDTLDINYIHVYNHLLQHTSIPNPCENSSCTGLCLLRPTVTKALNYTCLCPNFKSSEDETAYWCDELELKTEELKTENEREQITTEIKFYEDQPAEEVSNPSATKPWIVFVIAIVLCLAGFYLGWRNFVSE